MSPPSDDGYYEPNTTVTPNASASPIEYGEVVSYEWDPDGDGDTDTTTLTLQTRAEGS